MRRFWDPTSCRRWLALLILSMAVAGCKNSRPSEQLRERYGATARPPAAVAGPPPDDGRVRPGIVSVTPDTIDISDGRATGGTYTLEYTIVHPEKVEKAEISIYSPGIGEVAPRVEVPILEHGTVYVPI